MNKLTAGTAIVFDNTMQYGRLLPANLMFFESDHPQHESDAVVSDNNGELFVVSRSAIRLAYQNEIEAGHRIDFEVPHDCNTSSLRNIKND